MSNEIKFPLATTTWDEKEYDAIHEVTKSGEFTMGPKVQEFEKEFAKVMGTKYCVMVNSGSSANLLMIASLFFTETNRLKRGDEVIVPAVSWSTTYFPLQQYGLKLKFVDIDLHTLNFDLDALETAISDKTKLVLAVNLLGNPNNFSKINAIIGGRNIELVEDNCESMGAMFCGKMAGTFGKIGTFSTFFSHHISTMEGGLIVTDDEEIYHILLSLRCHGWTRDLPEMNTLTGQKNPDKFFESFRFVIPGYNLRPLELSGAIGLEQLKKLPSIVQGRRENAKAFKRVFSECDKFILQKEIGCSSWFGFSIIFNPTIQISLKALRDRLDKSEIEYRPIVAGNFCKSESIKYIDHEIHGEIKNADLVDKNGLFIGNHHWDCSEIFERIFEILNR